MSFPFVPVFFACFGSSSSFLLGRNGCRRCPQHVSSNAPWGVPKTWTRHTRNIAGHLCQEWYAGCMFSIFSSSIRMCGLTFFYLIIHLIFIFICDQIYWIQTSVIVKNCSMGFKEIHNVIKTQTIVSKIQNERLCELLSNVIFSNIKMSIFLFRRKNNSHYLFLMKSRKNCWL